MFTRPPATREASRRSETGKSGREVNSMKTLFFYIGPIDPPARWHTAKVLPCTARALQPPVSNPPQGKLRGKIFKARTVTDRVETP
jgi:hypothetical protein